ncbi:MAG: O-antigen ligase family protein [Pleurocapsa sp.]
MNTETKPANLPETLVWYYILGAYIIYLLGGQYVFAPLLATVMVGLVCQKWWQQTPKTPLSERINFSPLTWIWIGAMLMMEVALIIGHINFDLSIAQIVKSSLYWYKHWALFALFPVAAYLKIRPQIIYRASCIFCTLCLVLVVLSSLAYLVHFPMFSYVSPLRAFGGDDMYYTVDLLFREPTYNEGFRLQLFAPWPPALGLMGNIYFLLTYQETNPKWRWLGMLGAIAMIVMSVSRLAVICLLFVILVQWLMTNFYRTKVQLAVCALGFLMGILLPKLMEWLEELNAMFYQMRPGSSKVRSALGRMSLNRWWNEAPVWGHGINTSRGPAALGFMPIGTHNTWYGVLYLHGLIGFFCFLIPFILTMVDLISRVKNSQTARVGFCLTLVLLLFSFGENLENLAYLYWQGLLIIGIAIKENAERVSFNQKPLLFDLN